MHSSQNCSYFFVDDEQPELKGRWPIRNQMSNLMCILDIKSNRNWKVTLSKVNSWDVGITSSPIKEQWFNSTRELVRRCTSQPKIGKQNKTAYFTERYPFFYLRERYPSGHEGAKGFLHPIDAAMQRPKQVRHLFRLTFRLTNVVSSWMQGQ